MHCESVALGFQLATVVVMSNVHMRVLGSHACEVCPPSYGPPNHPQAHLSGPWVACVDAGIAPLVAELWAAGIPTSYSCERTGQDLAQLLFPHSEAFEKLLSLTRKSNSDEIKTLHQNMQGMVFDRWIITMASPHADIDTDDADADTRLRVNALVPLEDIRTLTTYLADLREGTPHEFPSTRADASPSQGRSWLGEARWVAMMAFEEAARSVGELATRNADEQL